MEGKEEGGIGRLELHAQKYNTKPIVNVRGKYTSYVVSPPATNCFYITSWLTTLQISPMPSLFAAKCYNICICTYIFLSTLSFTVAMDM